MLVIFNILAVLGWLVVPIAAAFKAYKITPSIRDGRPVLNWTWPIMYVYGNLEDGIENGEYYGIKNKFIQIVYWTCLRNPVNNLRYIPVLSVKVKKDKVKYFGSFDRPEDLEKYDTNIPQWFFAWQGLYSNVFVHFNLFGELRRFWLGWKLYPDDAHFELPPTSYRYHGAGFAIQFKRVKRDYQG
jgi:hypothetical protein